MSTFTGFATFIKISLHISHMKILTMNQSIKLTKKLKKELDTENYLLVEDKGSFYTISKDVKKLELQKYRIKQIGMPLR